jgi:hypothetical protein
MSADIDPLTSYAQPTQVPLRITQKLLGRASRFQSAWPIEPVGAVDCCAASMIGGNT